MTAAGLETHQEERAALAMAEALERLVAVINRELNSDASEGVGIVDPAWVDAIATVVRAAESSSAVLDEPDVLRVLTQASSILR